MRFLYRFFQLAQLFVGTCDSRLFTWNSSGGELGTILSIFPKLANKYSVTFVDDDENFKSSTFRVKTFDLKGGLSD